MASNQANQSDAEIVLKLYDLRRETVMRESRNGINGTFWPKSFEEAAAIMEMSHPLNAAFRQTSTYWEMSFSLLKHGAVNFDLLVENCGEGLFLYAKFEPFIEELRAKKSPTMFSNTSWAIDHSPWAQERMKMIRQRIQQMIAAK